jgi:hypothetical protein
MTNYLSIIRSHAIGLLIAGAIFYWGFANDGYVRMGLGILILYFTIKAGIDSYNYAIALDDWIENNKEKLVLFYPTKKAIQEKIKADFIPLIPYDIMQVYYEGPQLIGDIKRSIVSELMKSNTRIKVHNPVIFKITDNSIIIEELTELMRIKTDNIDFQALMERIEKINNS